MRIPAFLLIVLCSAFFGCKGRPYKVPSNGMAGTIPAGTRVYVTTSDSFRLNDVAIYNHYGINYFAPVDGNGKLQKGWQKYIHRIIAASGDTIRIIDNDVLLNGRRVPAPAKSWLVYKIISRFIPDDLPERNDYFRSPEQGADRVISYAYLTEQEAADYFASHQPAVSSVKKERLPADTAIVHLSPENPWSSTDFGPLYIPRPGDVVEVTETNQPLYQNIKGIHLGRNTITEKLYFVMGDNRMASEDSRYIGFIPQSNMHGVVK